LERDIYVYLNSKTRLHLFTPFPNLYGEKGGTVWLFELNEMQLAWPGDLYL